MEYTVKSLFPSPLAYYAYPKRDGMDGADAPAGNKLCQLSLSIRFYWDWWKIPHKTKPSFLPLTYPPISSFAFPSCQCIPLAHDFHSVTTSNSSDPISALNHPSPTSYASPSQSKSEDYIKHSVPGIQEPDFLQGWHVSAPSCFYPQLSFS